MGDPFTLAALGIGGVLAIAGVLWFVKGRRTTARHEKVLARTEKLGLNEPVSLHPLIDVNACIGTGSCVEVCPEKDVMGMIDGLPKLLKPAACIGHGECLRACPVDAITLVIGTEKRGVDLPLVDATFQTNVPGLYIAGELGGMGLIHNAVNQGQQAMRALVKSGPAKIDGVHQAVIVGAGPAGLAAGLAAKEAGLDYAILEQEQLGGAIRSYPRQKIVMTAPANLPIYGKVQLRRTTKEALLELWEQVVQKTSLTIESGVKVNEIKRGDDGVFTITTSTGVRRSQRVVLSIGRRGTPRKLGCPGENLEKITYRLLEPEQYQHKKVLVVGGGDSAVETALALSREPGTTVTLVYRGEKFDRIKPDNHDLITAAAESKKIDLRLKTNPKEICDTEVVLKCPDGAEARLPNDYVFVCIGGELPTAWLKKIGVEVKTMRGEAHPAMARS